ncbi:MAG TPA: ATP-binding cassette domain-containing protein [Mycobacteriales bacterium]|nr:ATP-binding cassette domain-containing protein [Mycobacteriales bacterium]
MDPDDFDWTAGPLGGSDGFGSSTGLGLAEPAAVCRDVHKTYVIGDKQIEALINVDKEFPASRVSTIVGPSGSGKSSLLRILACVDRPSSGSVRIGGHEVSALGTRRRRALRRTSVGYVFQNPVDNLIEYLDATAQLKLAAKLRGQPADPVEIDRLLNVLGLSPRASHLPVQLSGGEQQRLAFACAVMGRPAIVVADEPTAELDSASADRVLQAVHDLRDEGVAFLLSSHDPRVVESADHLLRLEHGRVVESW